MGGTSTIGWQFVHGGGGGGGQFVHGGVGGVGPGSGFETAGAVDVKLVPLYRYTAAIVGGSIKVTPPLLAKLIPYILLR